MYLWQKQAQTATFLALRLPPGVTPTKPVSPPPIWMMPWNRESTNCLPSLPGCEGKLMKNDSKDAGKKSLPIVTPSQAITNLDNFVVRMVMGLRPL